MPHKYTSDEKSFPKCDFLTRILVSDFLENDVGLWDAFFTKTSSKHQSVLRPAALPVDEYLQDHLRRGGEHQVRLLDIHYRYLSVIYTVSAGAGPLLAAGAAPLLTEAPGGPAQVAGQQLAHQTGAVSSLAPPVDNVDIASATPSLM